MPSSLLFCHSPRRIPHLTFEQLCACPSASRLAPILRYHLHARLVAVIKNRMCVQLSLGLPRMRVGVPLRTAVPRPSIQSRHAQARHRRQARLASERARPSAARLAGLATRLQAVAARLAQAKGAEGEHVCRTSMQHNRLPDHCASKPLHVPTLH